MTYDPVEELRQEYLRRSRCACIGRCHDGVCPIWQSAHDWYMEQYPAALRAKYVQRLVSKKAT